MLRDNDVWFCPRITVYFVVFVLGFINVLREEILPLDSCRRNCQSKSSNREHKEDIRIELRFVDANVLTRLSSDKKIDCSISDRLQLSPT